MVRRMVFYNWRRPFRRKDALAEKEMFSTIPQDAPLTVYDRDFWWSDRWDPLAYGREYDFSRPFFAQFRDLLTVVPVPARNIVNSVRSDYCDNALDLKNCYLSFELNDAENSAYLLRGEYIKESFDLSEARHTERSYGSFLLDEAYKVFFSVNCAESTEIWFSRNLTGCSHCFGCVNLRDKSYYIFNAPHTKEEYQRTRWVGYTATANFSPRNFRRLRTTTRWRMISFP